MRQLARDMPLVDDEGFPQAMAVKDGVGRDKESGELLMPKIQYITKRQELRLSPTIDSLLSADLLHPRLSEGRRFNGFRIRQFTRRSAWEEPWDGSGIFRNQRPPLQTCVYMKGGTPVHSTRRRSEPHQPFPGVARRGEDAVRQQQVFRVPRESLPHASSEQPFRNPNTICVNIWEEFLFGKSVITSRSGHARQPSHHHDREEEEEEEDDEGPINYVRRVFSPFLPRFVIDLLVYTVYFLVFFASCVGYNMFCELGCYILLAQHLKIHEKAYERKLDVEFTGSIFQGPLYALTRNWCEHCNERDRGKVVMRLMTRMKADILPPIINTTTTTNTSAQEATKDPP